MKLNAAIKDLSHAERDIGKKLSSCSDALIFLRMSAGLSKMSFLKIIIITIIHTPKEAR